MDHQSAAKVRYTVELARSGQWEVNVSNIVRPIASFSIKRDALAYARKLAQPVPAAEIRVRD